MTATADSNRKLLNRTGTAVALLLILILAAAMGAIMVRDIPEKSHDIMLVLVTVVANSVTGIVGFFFGSSVSTSRQGEIIAQQASTIASAQDKLAPVAGATPLRPVVPNPDETRYDAAVRLYGADSLEAKAEQPK